MNLAARIISILFHPLLMPTYAMLIALQMTPLFRLSIANKLTALGVTLSLTALLPLLLIIGLRSIKVVGSVSLDARRDRTIPYIGAILAYASALVYLHTASAPAWLQGFMLGALITLVVVAAINLRWKISAHSAAAAGVVGFILALAIIHAATLGITWVLTAAILAWGLVGSSRLWLERHTLLQVAAGAAVGLPVVLACTCLY